MIHRIEDRSSQLLGYLIHIMKNGGGRIPPLTELSGELGVSVASLREQLELARRLGYVEVHPRKGIRVLPYSFTPAVKQSLSYAVAINAENFEKYANLRNHIEKAYWFEAASLLIPEDHEHLCALIVQAEEKLHTRPIQIPHQEHRELHLSIYSRLGNPFVIGLLEAYWDIYEIAGLNLYADLAYLQSVWQSHRKMVECICTGDFEAGYSVFMTHTNLLSKRPVNGANQKFE